MAAVNARGPHLAALSGGLLEALRRALAAGERAGLRPSHHRLLDAVPPGGRGITDLAASLGMTKQGAGQLVAALEVAGFLVVRPDPADARRRVVVRTAEGERSVEDLRQRLDGLERQWAAVVGEERYAVFRAVLAELGDRPGPVEEGSRDRAGLGRAAGPGASLDSP